MSVASSAPANARIVYNILIALAVISVVVTCVVIGVISYEYVTREELRNPPEEEAGGGHSELPATLALLRDGAVADGGQE